MDVLIKGKKCERCGNEWKPQNENEEPERCPSCGSPYWNKPYKRIQNAELYKIISDNKEEFLNYFNSNIKKQENGCWNWRDAKKTYGVINLDGTQIKASRFSYMLFNGEIPKGLFICHKCDNKPCVNPKHLFAGTQKDNMQDYGNKKDKYRINRELKYNSGNKKYYTVNEIAKRFNLHPDVIYTMIKSKIIIPNIIGKHAYRFSIEEIERYEKESIDNS